MTVTSESDSESQVSLKQRFHPSAAPPGDGGETPFLNKTWVAAAAYWLPCHAAHTPRARATVTSRRSLRITADSGKVAAIRRRPATKVSCAAIKLIFK